MSGPGSQPVHVNGGASERTPLLNSDVEASDGAQPNKLRSYAGNAATWLRHNVITVLAALVLLVATIVLIVHFSSMYSLLQS